MSGVPRNKCSRVHVCVVCIRLCLSNECLLIVGNVTRSEDETGAEMVNRRIAGTCIMGVIICRRTEASFAAKLMSALIQRLRDQGSRVHKNVI